MSEHMEEYNRNLLREQPGAEAAEIEILVADVHLGLAERSIPDSIFIISPDIFCYREAPDYLMTFTTVITWP